MSQAQFVHGEPLMVDHTAGGSAIPAGTVLVVGTTTRIAHNDIAANEFGALAAGGGVYDVAKATGAGIDDGALVYFNTTNKNVVAASSGNTLMGRAIGSTASGATVQRVQHIA